MSLGQRLLLIRSAETTAQGFETNIPITLDPGETQDLEFEYELWIPIGEESCLTTQRVAELCEMTLVSRCHEGTPIIETLDTGARITLLFNQPGRLPDVMGVVPGEKIFRLKLLEPMP